MKKKLLSIISLLLVVCTLCSTLSGCHKHKFERIIKADLFVAEANYEHADLYKMSCACGDVSEQTFQTGSLLKYEVRSKSDMLKDKKILFVGNSMTHAGHCVIEKDKSIKTLELRQNDEGYFYYLCKENGADVSVTNWCYGGHNLPDNLGNSCNADRGCNGYDHGKDLTVKAYDYIIFQDTRWDYKVSEQEYINYMTEITNMFKEYNPNVKFFFLVQSAIPYTLDKYEWKIALRKLEEMQILTVVDWGVLCYDIWTGAVKVPGATEEYKKSTFIIADDHHPNMLSGYITALMLYCSITGETAVGQPFKFATDTSLSMTAMVHFMTAHYKNQHYGTRNETNFDKVLKSENEIRGIQQVVNQYVRTQQYTKYFN